jgi:hypothetical protein
MKLSKPLSALILIALALFLNAARNVSADSPSPRPTPHPNESADLGQEQAKQHPTPLPQPDLSYAPHGADTPAKEQQERDGASTVIVSVFTAIAGIATALIAWFNFQLVGVTKEMQLATEAAADATKAALHVNRPFLLVTDVKCSEAVRNSGGYISYSFTITLRNFGVGPADMVGYSAGGVPYDAPDLYGQREPKITYTTNDTPLRELIAPNDIAENLIPKVRLDLYDDMLRDIQTGKRRIGIDGQIRYRGAAPEQVYWTRFFWWCFINDLGEPTAIRRALRPDLNDHN